MDTDANTICKELAAIGKSLRVIGQILETGATVEAKRATNGAYDEPKKAAAKKATTATETEETEEMTTISARTVAAKAAKANSKKAAATDEEDFDLGQEEDETPTVTKKDLIAACRDNREAAIKVLKKMKVNSVHELKPTQYATVLTQIGAN